MKINKNTKTYKFGYLIGCLISNLLFVGLVRLITYGFLSLASYVFCFGVSVKGATASADLLLIVFYTIYFLGKGKKNV